MYSIIPGNVFFVFSFVLSCFVFAWGNKKDREQRKFLAL